MSNKPVTRIIRDIFKQHSKQQRGIGPHGAVRQDKSALPRDRRATSHPAPPVNPPRAQRSINRGPQAIRRTVPKSRTVHLTLWVDPIVKAELQRRATRSGLSVSATGSALLKRALQESIDTEYGALLEPIIRQEIRRQITSFSSRIALLLVRVAFAAEQTRNLVTNILARQPGVHPDVLDTLLDSSADAAKSKITAKTPQLERIINEVTAWFTDPHEKEGKK